MTERNRYRLMGAIFLIAVAAVVLPMLFDGEGVAPIHLDPVDAVAIDVQPDDAPPPDPTPALEARRELKSAIDEDGYATDTGTRIGEPALFPESDDGVDDEDVPEDLKWAVQVASFTQSENATALRDTLLAAGYAAFLSNAKRDGEVATRVAVGPLINRDDAAQLKTELDERYDFGAVVVRFGP